MEQILVVLKKKLPKLNFKLDIRAGREKNKVSGFGLAFSSAVVLITATERMSGFVLITNIPTSKAAGYLDFFLFIY